MGGGANCSKQIIVQCEKITGIFVFLAPKQFFTRREAKASLENYVDRLYFGFFLPNMHTLCVYSCHRRYNNRILYLKNRGIFHFYIDIKVLLI